MLGPLVLALVGVCVVLKIAALWSQRVARTLETNGVVLRDFRVHALLRLIQAPAFNLRDLRLAA